ncbi:MAG: HD domain-containing protein [Planctomycetes bacterium]|nr:HD domain-containing protein [Planctomycetota bacterium]
MVRCPGQDQRFWKPKDIFEVACPECGRAVEFFRDEPILKCRGCERTIVNSRLDMGCAEWCQHAEQCLGADTMRNIKTVRDKLVARMKGIFGSDEKRIDHALRVLDYAEQIGAAEGGDPLVIRAAAILHDIGIPEAQRRYGSAAGKYQEIEGPPIAEPILKDNNVDPVRIQHICAIIANHHSARDIDTREFRVLWDADWLVNLQEEFAGVSEQHRKAMIEKAFRTGKGRQLALELFALNEPGATGEQS